VENILRGGGRWRRKGTGERVGCTKDLTFLLNVLKIKKDGGEKSHFGGEIPKEAVRGGRKNATTRVQKKRRGDEGSQQKH